NRDHSLLRSRSSHYFGDGLFASTPPRRRLRSKIHPLAKRLARRKALGLSGGQQALVDGPSRRQAAPPDARRVYRWRVFSSLVAGRQNHSVLQLGRYQARPALDGLPKRRKPEADHQRPRRVPEPHLERGWHGARLLARLGSNPARPRL